MGKIIQKDYDLNEEDWNDECIKNFKMQKNHWNGKNPIFFWGMPILVEVSSQPGSVVSKHGQTDRQTDR